MAVGGTSHRPQSARHENNWRPVPVDIHIDESAIAQRLALSFAPEPDLLIRTGGERRISNFLLWQLAYAELYFSDVLWPDFNAAELESALRWYAGRQRRFGMTGEQVESEPSISDAA